MRRLGLLLALAALAAAAAAPAAGRAPAATAGSPADVEALLAALDVSLHPNISVADTARGKGLVARGRVDEGAWALYVPLGSQINEVSCHAAAAYRLFMHRARVHGVTLAPQVLSALCVLIHAADSGASTALGAYARALPGGPQWTAADVRALRGTYAGAALAATAADERRVYDGLVAPLLAEHPEAFARPEWFSWERFEWARGAVRSRVFGRTEGLTVGEFTGDDADERPTTANLIPGLDLVNHDCAAGHTPRLSVSSFDGLLGWQLTRSYEPGEEILGRYHDVCDDAAAVLRNYGFVDGHPSADVPFADMAPEALASARDQGVARGSPAAAFVRVLGDDVSPPDGLISFMGGLEGVREALSESLLALDARDPPAHPEIARYIAEQKRVLRAKMLAVEPSFSPSSSPPPAVVDWERLGTTALSGLALRAQDGVVVPPRGSLVQNAVLFTWNSGQSLCADDPVVDILLSDAAGGGEEEEEEEEADEALLRATVCLMASHDTWVAAALEWRPRELPMAWDDAELEALRGTTLARAVERLRGGVVRAVMARVARVAELVPLPAPERWTAARAREALALALASGAGEYGAVLQWPRHVRLSCGGGAPVEARAHKSKPVVALVAAETAPADPEAAVALRPHSCAHPEALLLRHGVLDLHRGVLLPVPPLQGSPDAVLAAREARLLVPLGDLDLRGPYGVWLTGGQPRAALAVARMARGASAEAAGQPLADAALEALAREDVRGWLEAYSASLPVSVELQGLAGEYVGEVRRGVLSALDSV